MNSPLPLVSLICTTAADEGAVQRFHGDLYRVLRALESAYRFEIVYAGAHQSAAVRSCVESLAQLDPRLRIRALSDDAHGTSSVHPGLADAASAMVILMDMCAHAPDLPAKLLELAQGPAELIEGVPAQHAAPGGWRRFLAKKAPTTPPRLVLVKRSALGQGLAAATLASWSETMNNPTVVRAQLPYVANVAAQRGIMPSRRWSVEYLAMWRQAPLELVSYFGATVFIVGVFLALWFTAQGIIAAGSVWFSWCYLIVLLHILGGSILFALGKLGALATRILERVDLPTDSAKTA